ncbi:glycosyltransferase [bacterium]|nr:glycosyltransferase [bacterium]
MSSLWTVYILIKIRPRIIYLQLSFMLLLICVLYKRIAGKRVVIIADCHTKALRQRGPRKYTRFFMWFKNKSFQEVEFTIISNSNLINDITKLHNRYFVIPDKIPFIRCSGMPDRKKYMVYVSSFAVDEPVHEIYLMSEKLDGIQVYWTGKINKLLIKDFQKPSNLIFTDYLSDPDYYKLICNADCIMALTTERDCLQCAAYEAMSVLVPVVVSDTTALRDYFRDAAVYTSHDPEEMAENVKKAMADRDRLIKNMTNLKQKRDKEFTGVLENLNASVEEIVRDL